VGGTNVPSSRENEKGKGGGPIDRREPSDFSGERRGRRWGGETILLLIGGLLRAGKNQKEAMRRERSVQFRRFPKRKVTLP